MKRVDVLMVDNIYTQNYLNSLFAGIDVPYHE
jgi:hypothetical protein